MDSANAGRNGGQGETGPEISQSETALRSEAAFWREMIDSSSGSLPPEAVERMRQALALVEWRIAGLHLETVQTLEGPIVKRGGASTAN